MRDPGRAEGGRPIACASHRRSGPGTPRYAEVHAELFAEVPPPWDLRDKGLTSGNGTRGILPYLTMWNRARNAVGCSR